MCTRYGLKPIEHLVDDVVNSGVYQHVYKCFHMVCGDRCIASQEGESSHYQQKTHRQAHAFKTMRSMAFSRVSEAEPLDGLYRASGTSKVLVWQLAAHLFLNTKILLAVALDLAVAFDFWITLKEIKKEERAKQLETQCLYGFMRF